MTSEILEALPIDAARFQPGTMFRSLFESVRTVLGERGDYPARGWHPTVSLRTWKLPLGAGLRELFAPYQLRVLYGQNQHGEDPARR